MPKARMPKIKIKAKGSSSKIGRVETSSSTSRGSASFLQRERSRRQREGVEEKFQSEKQRYEKLQQTRLSSAKVDIRNRVDQFMQEPAHPRQEEDARLAAAKSLYQASRQSKIKMAASATKLGITLRRQMKEGGGAAIQVAYAFAIVVDFADYIPAVGSFIAFFAGIALFFILWGTGKWKMKLLRFLLLALNVIPGVSMLPLALMSVWHASHVWKKKREKAELKYKKLQLKMQTAGIEQVR